MNRSFTHDTPGTPAARWRSHPRWGVAPPVTLEGMRRLVVVAAHPDDESLGAGALIAAAREQDIPVHLICATDGEASHPRSTTVTPEELAARRAGELVAAAAELGVAAEFVARLGLPDGHVAEGPERLVKAIVDVVGDGRDCIIAAPWREDGHVDHEAAGWAAAAAARRTDAALWEYPIWFWHWGDPDGAPWHGLRPHRVSAAALAAKQRAIATHASQLEPLSDQAGDEPVLGPGLLEHFRDHERFWISAGAECSDTALERLHQRRPDPWGVRTRWYEQRKRSLVLAMLPRRELGRVLDLGCSTGLLATDLAGRASHVLAVDSSRTAVAAAQQELHRHPNAKAAVVDVPRDWPPGPYDLIVVSELGYFLSPADLERLAHRIAGDLSADGVVLLCHWRHPVRGWVLDGDEVHRRLADGPLPPVRASYRDDDFAIQVHAPAATWPQPRR